jgi:uncharacterized membrane protein
MAAKKVSSSGGSGDEGKTIAIVSYITWIGWVIALIMNMDKKNEFAKFHLRQTLLIWLGALLTWIPFIGWIWGVFLFILWIIGLIGAVNGEKKEVPLLGPLAQDWFKGL